MLIMPYSHDQPDNARRMEKLKVGRTIQRTRYTPLRVARRLKKMLEDPLLREEGGAGGETRGA